MSHSALLINQASTFQVFFQLNNIEIPQYCYASLNGTLSICIKLGAVKVCSNESRPLNKWSNQCGITIDFNQVLECGVDHLPAMFTVQLRIRTSMHGRSVHKVLATERLPLTLPLTEGQACQCAVSFVSLSASARLRYIIAPVTSVKPPVPVENNAGMNGVIVSTDCSSVASAAEEDGGGNTEGTTPRAAVGDGQACSVTYQSLAKPGEDSTSASDGHHSNTPRESEATECPHCARAAATATSALRDLRRCQHHLHSLTERRAKEKSGRQTKNAAVEAHVHQLFIAKEHLKTENAYLLKCLIDAKVRPVCSIRRWLYVLMCHAFCCVRWTSQTHSSSWMRCAADRASAVRARLEHRPGRCEMHHCLRGVGIVCQQLTVFVCLLIRTCAQQT
jgi:hypothetical protein